MKRRVRCVDPTLLLRFSLVLVLSTITTTRNVSALLPVTSRFSASSPCIYSSTEKGISHLPTTASKRLFGQQAQNMSAATDKDGTTLHPAGWLENPGSPPSNFAARRPHAAQLGSFELPPPPMHKYLFTGGSVSHSSPTPTTIASVGNLLTPPAAIHGNSSSSLYGYPAAQYQRNQHGQPSRGLKPPTYEIGAQLPPFALDQWEFPYSTGPSPHPSTSLSPKGMPGHLPTPQYAEPQESLDDQRSAQLVHSPGLVPVLSNINNPSGGLALVSTHPGMMPGFNSGHAAQMPRFMMGHVPHSSQFISNDRPFKCDQCPSTYNRMGDLRRHKKKHLAVKPFPCNHCDKSFSRKDVLKVGEH